MKKNKLNSLSELTMVFSTGAHKDQADLSNEEYSTSQKNSQTVRVQLNTRLKAGKSATIVYGLDEPDSILEQLCKQMKQKCGVGGSVKNGEIILQGDQVQKIISFLKEIGYHNTKKSGG